MCCARMPTTSPGWSQQSPTPICARRWRRSTSVGLERPTNIRVREPLVAAIRRVLDGERDADALCEALGQEDALIVQVILRCLENPETLRNVLGGQAEDDAPPEPPMSR